MKYEIEVREKSGGGWLFLFVIVVMLVASQL